MASATPVQRGVDAVDSHRIVLIGSIYVDMVNQCQSVMDNRGCSQTGGCGLPLSAHEATPISTNRQVVKQDQKNMLVDIRANQS